MRRKDREITDAARIDAIIQDCDCCRLGLVDAGRAYIVPMNFGYQREDGKPVFYFHGAREGRKMDLLRRDGSVCFELDTNHLFHPHEVACNNSFRFQSVMGTGTVRLLDDMDAKRMGMNVVLAHLTHRDNWDFDEKALAATAILRLEVDEITCKEHA